MDWLSAEGFAVDNISQRGFAFIYRIHLPTRPQHKLSISQSVDDDKLVVAAGLVLDESDKAVLRGLSEKVRAWLMKDLGWLLHSRPVLFQMNEEASILSNVAISHAIYLDGLTKDRLMTAINEIHKAEALFLIRLSDYLENARPLGQQPSGQLQSTVCPRCQRPVSAEGKYCGACGYEFKRIG